MAPPQPYWQRDASYAAVGVEYTADRFVKSEPMHTTQRLMSTSYDTSSMTPSIVSRPKSRPLWYSGAVYWVKWLSVTILISVIISIPMIVLKDTLGESGTTDLEIIKKFFENQWKNLCFWIFAWLLVSWLSACVFHAFASVFPYIFRYVARYINAAHGRYWRVFNFMKWPVTLLGCTIGSYTGYGFLISNNNNLSANYDFTLIDWSQFGNASVQVNTTTNGNDTSHTVTVGGVTFNDSGKQALALAQDIINDVLFNLILWVALYFVEKCVILYISIHYNARSNFSKLAHCKEIVSVLVKLYDASIYLYPLYKDEFRTEDVIIHDNPDSQDGYLRPTRKFLRVVGTGTQRFTSALGHLVNSNNESHWLDPQSSYAIVSRALDHAPAAAALAKRIWVSLASHGENILTVNDITAALGPDHFYKPEHIFLLLDENENGNIRLDEFVCTVVETGKMRQNIYAAVTDINHALNIFDWVLCIILAVGMVFFILVSWVSQIAALRQNISVLIVGAAFIVGRIGHEFFAGAIFVFFKHAFDVGDHVSLYNAPESNHVPCIVKRISLLYVVFERVDNGIEMQMPNDKLNAKRIENLSRSGINREQIDLHINFDTTFKDIQYLRNELSAFLSLKDNRRDYRPFVDVRVKAVPNLQTIQLQCSFWHKSNWSNEELRAARSSKFVCELLRVVRNIPISKPGGSGPKTGDEGKPSYIVSITEEEAIAKRAAESNNQREKRIDFVKPADEELAKQEPTVPADPRELSDEASAELEAKNRKEEEETTVLKKKKAKQEKEKEEARLAELAALQQLTEIPLVGNLGRPSAPWESNDGMRNRSPFSFISGWETGMRSKESYQPFYPPRS